MQRIKNSFVNHTEMSLLLISLGYLTLMWRKEALESLIKKAIQSFIKQKLYRHKSE